MTINFSSNKGSGSNLPTIHTVTIDPEVAIEHKKLTKALTSGNTRKFLQELKNVVIEKGKEKEILEYLKKDTLDEAISYKSKLSEAHIRTILNLAEVEYKTNEEEDFNVFNAELSPETLESFFDFKFNAMMFVYHQGIFYSIKKEYKQKKARSTVQKIYDQVNPLVIGQDDALKQVITNYYICKTAIDVNRSSQLEVKKPSFLLQGGSGCGKTFMLEQIAIALDIPFVTFDASSLTAAGYVGANVDDIVEALIEEHIDRGAQNRERLTGIVLLDEIDKLSSSGAGGDARNDVGTIGAQRNLLKLLDGKEYRMDGGSSRSKYDGANLDISEVIFVFAGAFSNYVNDKKAKGNKTNIGFGKKLKEDNAFTLSEQDLIDAGMMPELVGRIGRVIRINDLKREDFHKILADSKNSYINQYKKISAGMGLTVEFDEEEIKNILDEAEKLKLGARGVKSIADRKFTEKLGTYLFD